MEADINKIDRRERN